MDAILELAPGAIYGVIPDLDEAGEKLPGVRSVVPCAADEAFVGGTELVLKGWRWCCVFLGDFELALKSADAL
jgi:hypothetical protein